MTTTTSRRLLSIPETVEYLDHHLTEARVYSLVAEGLLPGVSIGRRRFVDRVKLDALIDAGGVALSGGWRHAPVELDDDDPPPTPTSRSAARAAAKQSRSGRRSAA